MTFFDTILLIGVVVATVVGFKRGLVGQVASLASLAIGVAVCVIVGDEAVAFYRSMNPQCREWPHAPFTVPAVVLGSLFLLVSLTVRVIGLLVKNTLRRAKATSLLDRMGGVGLNVFKWLLLLSVLLNFMLMASPRNEMFTTRHALDNKPFEATLNLLPYLLGRDVVPSDSIAPHDSVPLPSQDCQAPQGVMP